MQLTDQACCARGLQIMKFGVRIPTEVLAPSLAGDLPTGEWCFESPMLSSDGGHAGSDIPLK